MTEILIITLIVELAILLFVTILAVTNPTVRIKRRKGYLYFVDANGYVRKSKAGPKKKNNGT